MQAQADTVIKSEIVSRNPATGEEIGRAPVSGAEDIKRALTRSREAQREWSTLSFKERGRFVMKAREIILEHLDEIAELISSETGKPPAEATAMELAPTLDLMRYFATNAANLLKPERISIGQFGLLGRTSRIIYKPLGVVGIISPWNFPWGIPMGEIAMALMAGNAVILKPSELTPLTGLKIGEVFKEAGLPESILTVLTGDGSTGRYLVEAGVDKIMFTGSVATGRRVAEAAGARLIPVVLELGGKDPMIVLEDAAIENAATGAVWGAFANAGQACASVERCYVHQAIADKFLEAVVEKVKALRLGAPGEDGVDLGPLSSERQLEIVEDHVSEAITRGARILTGGRRAVELGQLFYEPTVLIDVGHSMSIMRDETFGPILPVMVVESEQEAVRLANDTSFGLTASVWTRDIARGRRVAELLEAGTVTVNEVMYTHGIPQTPWGGIKQSGMGRTHGRLGLLELVQPVHVHVNRLSMIPDVWWFHYTSQAAQLFKGMARRFASGSLLQTSLLLPQMIRRIRKRLR